MPNSKTNLAVFVILLVVLGALVWTIVNRRQSPSIPEPAHAKLSPQINIDVYVDGSGSMKNFLKTGNAGGQGENFLLEFLQACENELSNPPASGGWSHGSVGFWRFGADATRLPTGDLRILANNPEGFHLHDKQVLGFHESRTSIQVPVNKDPQEHAAVKVPELKIIVTDLYQTYGTNSEPAKALADTYLTDAGAVAIYGIRNPYSGPVEDLPALKGASLPNGAADTMPFYIIIAGDNAADVYHAQEVLMAANTIGPVLRKAFDQKRAFVMYFSKQPGWEVASHSDTNSDPIQVQWQDPKNPRKKNGIGPPLKTDFHDSLDLLTIRKGKALVRFSMPEQITDKTNFETPIGDSFDPHTLAYVSQPAGKGKSDIQREDKRAEKTVKVERCPGSQDICATFDYDHLHGYKGVYLFQIDVRATKVSDVTGVTSEQMKRWNIEDGEETVIASNKAKPAFPFIPGVGGLHPGRTPNLSGVLTALQNRVFTVTDPDIDPVVVTRYQLYVEAK